MNVPLVAAGLQGMRGAVGIQIWSIDLEIDNTAWAKLMTTTAQYIAIMLSQVSVTAEMFQNNRDVLYKWKAYSVVAANGHVVLTNQSWSDDFYPAIPFYGQQLHLGVLSGLTTTAITVYCKVWYSMVQLSQGELVQQLQNQLT